MSRAVLVIGGVLILFGAVCHAQEETAVTVDTMEFCSGIENRQPVGATSQFFSEIDKIYCFTRITGATDTMTIQHVWYFGDDEKARVELPVRSRSWRTWSSKRMVTDWAGVWRVDIVMPDGTVLMNKEFVYKPMVDE